MTDRDAYPSASGRRMVVETPPDLIDPIMDEMAGRRINARLDFIAAVRSCTSSVAVGPRPASRRVRGRTR